MICLQTQRARNIACIRRILDGFDPRGGGSLEVSFIISADFDRILFGVNPDPLTVNG
jgi:hypothetical protein